MNVIALNSSPRGGGRSKTELMLNHLVEGMRAAGAEVDTVTLREKKSRTASVVSPAGPKPPASASTKTI